MLESLIFKLENGAFFLYSYKKRCLLNLAENVYLLCDLFLNRKIPIEQVCKYAKDHKINQSDYDYFLFLKNNDFLSPLEIKIFSSISVDALSSAFCELKILVFEITKKCNLNCSYCIYGDLYDIKEKKCQNDYLSFSKAKAILDYIYQWCLKNKISKRLTLSFYGGEPLLGFEIIRQIVEYAESISSDILSFKYDMTTNGVLLSKYIQFLIKYDFSLLVSLDGDEYASSYRVNVEGRNLYETISSTLLKLKKNNPEYFKKNVKFNAIIHQRNSLSGNIVFFKNKFGILPYFTELTRINVKPNKNLNFQSIYKSLEDTYRQEKTFLSDADKKNIRQEYSQLRGFLYNLLNKQILNNYSQLFVENISEIIPSATCLPFSYKIFVSTDGILYPCEKIGYKYAMGSISNIGKVSIDYISLKEKYDRLYSEVASECENCYNLFTCEVCLFSLNAKCKAVSKDEFIKKIQISLEDEDLDKIF